MTTPGDVCTKIVLLPTSQGLVLGQPAWCFRTGWNYGKSPCKGENVLVPDTSRSAARSSVVTFTPAITFNLNGFGGGKYVTPGLCRRIGVLWGCVWCPSWEDLTAVALNLGPGGAHPPTTVQVPTLSSALCRRTKAMRVAKTFLFNRILKQPRRGRSFPGI